MIITAVAESIEQMVDYYECFLTRNGYHGHRKRFGDRLKNDPHSARGEAVVFQMLWSQGLHPDIFEDNSTGGPDFSCHADNGGTFLVEVASLDVPAVSKRSKLPLRIQGPGGGPYGLITQKLFSVVQSKAPQLGGRGLPGVLAITCEYDFAHLLMDRKAAQDALGSTLHVRVPIQRTSQEQHSRTWDPKGGIFWSPSALVDLAGYPTLLPRYETVSAVLLISIFPNESNVVGILHPAPVRPFQPEWFPNVPYVRFKQWPVANGQFELEWTQDGHAVFTHRHLC